MQEIDIVYPLSEGLSHFRNEEIRYSLRSVEKYVKNYRNIYIIGDKPRYLNEKIIHIPFRENPSFCKERRIMEKFYFASGIPEISDNFLMFNDDYYFKKNFNAQKVNNYYKSKLEDSINNRKEGTYKTSLKNTYEALKKKGYQTYNYDIHYPLIYNKQKFREVMESYDWDVRLGYVVKSLYANTLGVKGYLKRDYKLKTEHDKEKILEKIEEADIFSTGEITRTIIGILNEFYPEKSIFEK